MSARRPVPTTTAKIGRDTLLMLRDVQRSTVGEPITLDEAIWLLFESSRTGIPVKRSTYRLRARGARVSQADALSELER